MPPPGVAAAPADPDTAVEPRHPRADHGGAAHPVAQRLAINNFDLLRVLFASTVMVFHLGLLSQAGSLAWMRDIVSGSFGLQGFFFVSGFLVTMSYDRSRDLKSYALKRARRIAPAYLTVVLGAALLLVFMSRLDWASYFSDPGWRSYVFWNVLLANFAAPDLPGVFDDNFKQAVNGSLWTIKIEAAFYCLVPVAAYLCRRAGFWRIMLAIFVASIAWRVGFDLLGRMTDSGFLSKLAIQIPGQLSFFAAGAIAYERTRLGLSPPRLWMALAAAAAYALTSDLLHDLIAPLCVGVIVYWAAIAAPYLGRGGRYGDFSYGIYLYHWPIIQVFIALGWFKASPPVAAVGAIASVVIGAVLSWHLLEKRFLTHRKPLSPVTH